MARFDKSSFTSWLSLLLTLTFLAGWILAFVGVGEMDNDCKVGEACATQLRPIWWALVLETFTFIFLFLAWAFQFVDKVRSALIAFLVLSAVNTEDEAESALRNREDDGVPGSLQSGFLVLREDIEHSHAVHAAVGFIMLTLCNFLFILILGTPELSEAKLPSVSVSFKTAKGGDVGDGGEGGQPQA